MVLSLLYFTIKIQIVHVVLIVLIYLATEKMQEEIKRRERCMPARGLCVTVASSKLGGTLDTEAKALHVIPMAGNIGWEVNLATW